MLSDNDNDTQIFGPNSRSWLPDVVQFRFRIGTRTNNPFWVYQNLSYFVYPLHHFRMVFQNVTSPLGCEAHLSPEIVGEYGRAHLLFFHSKSVGWSFFLRVPSAFLASDWSSLLNRCDATRACFSAREMVDAGTCSRRTLWKSRLMRRYPSWRSNPRRAGSASSSFSSTALQAEKRTLLLGVVTNCILRGFSFINARLAYLKAFCKRPGWHIVPSAFLLQ